VIDLPVADPWFVRAEVGDGITLVSEPHVHALLRCNVWLVPGRTTNLVVDTAMGLAPLRLVVERDLERDLVAVATHVHGDHVGGLQEFSERAIHRAEVAELGAAALMSLESAHYGETVIGPYREAGYEIPELFVDASPPGGFASTVFERGAVTPTRVLDEGDIVDLGDRSFEVLHLPGHSRGSIGLWELSTGTLFSGDAIYDGPLLDELDGSDIDAYLTTVRRLRELPVTIVHGGHEPSFGRERLVELCDRYLDLRG
jgi:glyoxylase-like metal-dependent hydrolase (beta-lactamase superfamily II)